MSEEGITMSEAMTTIAFAIDRTLNGEEVMTSPDTVQRANGFVLLMYPYGDHSGRSVFISNGASREDVIRMFESQIEKLKKEQGIEEVRPPLATGEPDSKGPDGQ